MIEDFRRGLEGLKREDIAPKLEVYIYEVNLLMRLARTYGVTVSVDTVEREHYTEIVVRTHDSD